MTLALAADVLVLASVATGAALALALAGRRSATWRHGVLRTGVLLVAAAPALAWAAGTIGLPRWSSAPPALAAAPAPFAAPPVTPLPALERTLPAAHVPAPPQRRVERPDAATLALALWCAGVAVGLLRLLHGARKVARLRREARPVEHPILTRAAALARPALGIPTLPPIHAAPRAPVPLALGLLRPRIVLPARLFDELDARALRDVLIHECAHVLRRDAWTALLQRSLAIALWPHPLVHLANRALDRAREELCDNHVLAASDPVSYSRTLLAVARGAQRARSARGARAVPALSLFPPRWSLERRVAGLLDTRRRPMTRLSRPTAILALAALTAASLGAAAVHTFQPLARQDLAAAPDVSGVWDGGAWGTVTIRGEEGTYTGTWSGAPGTLRLARTGRGALSGFWRESDLHGGTLELEVAAMGKILEGTYRVHRRAQHRPDHEGAVRWTFVRPVDDIAADASVSFLSRGERDDVLVRKKDVSVADRSVQNWELFKLEQAIRQDPGDPKLLCSLGKTLFDLGRLEEASALLRRALALRPDDSGALGALAEVRHRAGDLEEAEALLNRALELDPADAALLMQLGGLHVDTGRYEAARELFEAALERTSRAGDLATTLRALRELIAIAERMGDLERVRQIRARIEGLEPEDGDEPEPEEEPDEPKRGAGGR